jgi:ABC-type antimicrobial peptide transport system permease subunit
MGSLLKTGRRALRNLARAPVRAGMMTLLIAVGICLALIMATVNSAFASRIDQIKGTVGADVLVRPAGSGGGFFGGRGGDSTPQYLSADDVSKLGGIAHVASVSSAVNVTAPQTNLTAPARNFPNQIGGFTANPRFQTAVASGTPAAGFGGTIRVIGTDASGPLSLIGGGTATVSSGRGFGDADANANVAIVGQRLATANNLQVNSTFQLQGASITVVGIFNSQSLFGDNAAYLPLKTAQRLFGLGGQVSEATVSADSAENVSAVATSIQNALGSNNVDVTTSTDQFDRIAGPLESAQRASRIALITALLASAGIILFTTILATRQRIREIGILKAIGASGWQVGAQFAIETLVIALIAGIVGALVTFPTAQSVANGLVSAAGSTGGEFGGRGRGVIGGAIASATGKVSVAVTPAIFVYAVAIALVLALLASAAPAWRVSSVRPAEVLRYE